MTADSVEAWLADWSRISKIAQELYARRHIATTLNTADAEAETNYLTFLSDVNPQLETAEQELKQKLLNSGLEPAGFEVPLRNMRAEAALFREANLPLLVENRKLGSQYNKISGAQVVSWEGQELTLQQMRPITQHADRAMRERAWRLTAERWLTDRSAINELWTKLVPLRRQIALNAGCTDYRAYRWRELLRFDYTPEDCATFQTAIEEVVVPAATRIYTKARRRLGVDSVRPWDCDQDRDPLNFPTLKPRAGWIPGLAAARLARNDANSRCDGRPQVIPLRVLFLNQFYLPRPIPFLQLLFPQDRLFHAGVQFVIDQRMHAVLLGEAFGHVILVLPYPLDQIAGDADV